MNAALVTLVCLLSLIVGYRYYAKLLSSKIFKTDSDNTPTPATVVNDGIDYVPTKKYVLFGHHFSSIAGAAPILGPAIAIIWGWVPALLQNRWSGAGTGQWVCMLPQFPLLNFLPGQKAVHLHW